MVVNSVDCVVFVITVWWCHFVIWWCVRGGILVGGSGSGWVMGEPGRRRTYAWHTFKVLVDRVVRVVIRLLSGLLSGVLCGVVNRVISRVQYPASSWYHRAPGSASSGERGSDCKSSPSCLRRSRALR